MKPILFCDPCHQECHNQFNMVLLEKISLSYPLEILASTNSYHKLAKLNNVKISKIRLVKTICRAQAFIHLRDLLNTLMVGLHLTRFKGYTVILGNHNILAIAFFQFLFPKDTLVIYHAQADEFRNRTKSYLLSLYASRFIHVFMANSIESYFRSFFTVQVPKTRVLRHPVYRELMQERSNDSCDLVLCLSSSFNHSTIRKLVHSNRLHSILTESHKKLVLRESSITANDFAEHPNILIVSNLLPYENYKKLLERAFLVIFVPNHTFHNRFSGTIVDAVSARIGVVTVPSLSAFVFREEFGKIINIADSEADIIEILIKSLKYPASYPQLTDKIDSYDAAYAREVNYLISSMI